MAAPRGSSLAGYAAKVGTVFDGTSRRPSAGRKLSARRHVQGCTVEMLTVPPGTDGQAGRHLQKGLPEMPLRSWVLPCGTTGTPDAVETEERAQPETPTTHRGGPCRAADVPWRLPRARSRARHLRSSGPASRAGPAPCPDRACRSGRRHGTDPGQRDALRGRGHTLDRHLQALAVDPGARLRSPGPTHGPAGGRAQERGPGGPPASSPRAHAQASHPRDPEPGAAPGPATRGDGHEAGASVPRRARRFPLPSPGSGPAGRTEPLVLLDPVPRRARHVAAGVPPDPAPGPGPPPDDDDDALTRGRRGGGGLLRPAALRQGVPWAPGHDAEGVPRAARRPSLSRPRGVDSSPALGAPWPMPARRGAQT